MAAVHRVNTSAPYHPEILPVTPPSVTRICPLSTHLALIVLPVDSGLWRVKESGGEKLLDFFGKAAAVHFATAWAKMYSFAEVMVYNQDAELEQIIPPHMPVWSSSIHGRSAIAWR